MDRGLRRCTGFTTRRCLVCHFAAVAADKTKTCGQHRHGLRASHQYIPSLACVVYVVIHAAFGHAQEKCWHASHLGPEYGRVTTALRCVVTQPLAHGSRRDRQLPVTSTASEKLGRPSGGSRLLHCNNATRSRSEKLFPRRRRDPPVPSGESTVS